MLEYFTRHFMPHGHCYGWDPTVLWLNVLSDAIIALAYYSIPIALVYLVRRRDDLAFNWIFKLFAAFILACGTTHVMEIWNVWHGDYLEAGVVKLVTASISIVAAILMWPLIPRALQIPSTRQLASVNDQLKTEVSEHRATQEELKLLNRNLEKRVDSAVADFRQLADSMPQIVWTARPDGTFEYHNRRWHEFNNRNPLSSESAGLSSRLHPDDVSLCAAAWEKAVQSGTPYEAEGRILDQRTGEYRWHLARAIPVLDGTGKVMRWYGTSTDMHAHKQLESDRTEALTNERNARLELERANLLKDEFLATLSHELRTPLNAILGWVQLIQRGRLDSERSREALDTVEKNARVQAQLIEDLLDMNRILSGKVSLKIEDVDLSVALTAALDTVVIAAQAKRIAIHKQIPADLPLLRGDAQRLQQIFWNLFSNAIKFTEPGGSLSIEIEKLSEQVRMTISDTGLGIDPAFLPHVFERFRQADSSTTRRYGGLGLGLSIVKNLVELLGGQISVHSQGLGKGTAFTITLPFQAPVLPSDQNKEAQRRPAFLSAGSEVTGTLKDAVVLVVDDELDAREIVKENLVEYGAKVLLASSASQALQIVKEHKPDLIISDVGMPEQDGFQFIRAVRNLAVDDGGNIPALALTAFARNEDRAQALRCGYQAHLTKPLNPTELAINAAVLLKKRP